MGILMATWHDGDLTYQGRSLWPGWSAQDVMRSGVQACIGFNLPQRATCWLLAVDELVQQHHWFVFEEGGSVAYDIQSWMPPLAPAVRYAEILDGEYARDKRLGCLHHSAGALGDVGLTPVFGGETLNATTELSRVASKRYKTAGAKRHGKRR